MVGPTIVLDLVLLVAAVEVPSGLGLRSGIGRGVVSYPGARTSLGIVAASRSRGRPRRPSILLRSSHRPERHPNGAAAWRHRRDVVRDLFDDVLSLFGVSTRSRSCSGMG